MTAWTNPIIKSKLKSSDSWVARAIYRLACDFNSIQERTTTFEDDKKFFTSLNEFYSDYGFFTDRHIAVARAKIRDPYINYLVTIANY